MISWEYTKQISWEYTSRYPDSPGTCTLSKTTSEVLDPLIPSLSSLGLVVNLDTSCGHRDIFSNISLITSWHSNYCTKPMCTAMHVLWKVGFEWFAKFLTNLLHNEGSDAASTGVRVGLGVDHHHISIRSIGDPELVAVEQVVVSCERERERISNLHTISSLFKH